LFETYGAVKEQWNNKLSYTAAFSGHFSMICIMMHGSINFKLNIRFITIFIPWIVLIIQIIIRTLIIINAVYEAEIVKNHHKRTGYLRQ
jgi:hypothetical protein